MMQALQSLPEMEAEAVAEGRPLDVPVLIERAPEFRDHPAYLETFHELTIKTMAEVHNLLARDEPAEALNIVAMFRAKTDDMWEVRKAEAAKTVRQ